MLLPKDNMIFVVDDDEDDQFLINQVLKRHLPDTTIQLLEDGEALLDQLTQSEPLPSLVLLDLNMPRMGGLEALKVVRQHARYQQLPIVVLTTSDSPEDRQRASRYQANDYLVKPPSARELNQLLSRVIEQWL